MTFDDVRKIALQFDHVEESTSYGTPAFKLRGKLVARLPVVHPDAMRDLLGGAVRLASAGRRGASRK